MKPNLNKEIEKEFDEKLEFVIRRAMIEGYEMGKDQLKKPYDYTLDDDKGEKYWYKFRNFYYQKIKSLKKCPRCQKDWVIHDYP